MVDGIPNHDQQLSKQSHILRAVIDFKAKATGKRHAFNHYQVIRKFHFFTTQWTSHIHTPVWESNLCPRYRCYWNTIPACNSCFLLTNVTRLYIFDGISSHFRPYETHFYPFQSIFPWHVACHVVSHFQNLWPTLVRYHHLWQFVTENSVLVHQNSILREHVTFSWPVSYTHLTLPTIYSV